MRKPLCLSFCLLLVLMVAKVEWDNQRLNPNRVQPAELPSDGEAPLQTIRISERALQSHKLPLESEAAVVLDTKKGEVLFGKNMGETLPIASLTKLMSVLVFLEANPNLDYITTITATDADCPGVSELKVGETVTLRDLLHAALMNSGNRATRALARASGLSLSDFVARMNQRARKLGLENTFFREPTGLDARNKSTALDCAKLLYFALQDSIIASVSGKTTYQFVSLDRERRRHRVGSTNKLLFNSFDVKGGKTGYIRASGWCLGTMLQGDEGEEVVAVVLGAPSKHSRLTDVRSIVHWSLEGRKRGS
jgi:D-alanyl-D-alanine endopeptidase (penicillin-binding protein 7)